MTISPARFALAALLAGLASGKVHAQPAQTPPPAPPAKTPGAGLDAPPADQTTESPAMAEARSLYIEGNAHYQAGRYALAAERFIKAFELSGKPALLFNLANTYERAGNYEKAAHYLRMYLDGGEVHDASSVKARLQRLELAVIELQKSGDNTDKTPEKVQPARPPADAPAAPVVVDRPSRVPYYVAGGGVVAGAAAAVVFGLRARSERSDIAALCMEEGGGFICPAEADSHLTNERRYALISDIGVGVAAASLATGLIYYFVTRDSGTAPESKGQALSIIPTATSDGLGVVAAGRF